MTFRNEKGLRISVKQKRRNIKYQLIPQKRQLRCLSGPREEHTQGQTREYTLFCIFDTK